MQVMRSPRRTCLSKYISNARCVLLKIHEFYHVADYSILYHDRVGYPRRGKVFWIEKKIISICRWYVAIRADTDSGGCSYETVSMASAGTVIPERGGEDKGVEKFRLGINAIAFSVQLRGDL